MRFRGALLLLERADSRLTLIGTQQEATPVTCVCACVYVRVCGGKGGGCSSTLKKDLLYTQTHTHTLLCSQSCDVPSHSITERQCEAQQGACDILLTKLSLPTACMHVCVRVCVLYFIPPPPKKIGENEVTKCTVCMCLRALISHECAMSLCVRVCVREHMQPRCTLVPMLLLIVPPHAREPTAAR